MSADKLVFAFFEATSEPEAQDLTRFQVIMNHFPIKYY